ncbi:MAG: Rrf2 family transcriptional regulator [Bacillota bacterium]|nr:Rrf2 family transcriptional regulator [Bacillota bacterium]
MEVIKRDTDYAFRALVYLALRHPQVVSARELADRQGIPMAFLQKLLQKLTRAGLVRSRRGAQGGFTLVKEPGEVTAEDVVEAVQGQIAMNRCLLGETDCENAGSCPVKRRLEGIQRDVKKALQGVTLQELASDTRKALR